MHEPSTVAFDIRNPFTGRTAVTIWHVDPECDGSDDSCGWFPRSRHGDAAVLERIKKRFEIEWTHGVPNGWFSESGEPNYSTLGIVIGMFRIAANEVYGHWSRRAERFLRRHAFDILHFAENNCDSLVTFVQQPFGINPKETAAKRAEEAAHIVYGWILRTARPWWRHPKWHVWHWKLQVHGIQAFKRWAFSRCCECGKRFKWGESPVSGNWHGTGPLWFRSEKGIHHCACRGSYVVNREVLSQ